MDMKASSPTSFYVDENLITLVWWKIAKSVIFTLIVALVGSLVSR